MEHHWHGSLEGWGSRDEVLLVDDHGQPAGVGNVIEKVRRRDEDGDVEGMQDGPVAIGALTHLEQAIPVADEGRERVGRLMVGGATDLRAMTDRRDVNAGSKKGGHVT